MINIEFLHQLHSILPILFINKCSKGTFSVVQQNKFEMAIGFSAVAKKPTKEMLKPTGKYKRINVGLSG